ncbi:hypothetical protein E2C01_041696 [Portunus trituberculatus]|uniref:Uncharacterized protein n=1 Tax=Portunus trituberculatus TaxID=210409 RepID=A0A5B7FRC5_PORTR|nr:hypothetical protein [Portunus trituberculatus]
MSSNNTVTQVRVSDADCLISCRPSALCRQGHPACHTSPPLPTFTLFPSTICVADSVLQGGEQCPVLRMKTSRHSNCRRHHRRRPTFSHRGSRLLAAERLRHRVCS